MKSKSTLLLRGGIALLVFGLAAWIGHGIPAASAALDRSNRMKAARGAAASSRSSSRDRDTGSRTGGHGHELESPEARARRVAAVKQRVKDLWMIHPDFAMNWELYGETHRLLATLEPEELDSFLHELPPMGGLPSHTFLRFEIAKAWAVKDGPAAIAGCAVGHRIDFICRAQAIGAWGAKDPAGAIAWLRQEQLPEDIEKHRVSMRANLFRDLAKSHFDLVAKELPLLSEQARKDLLPTMVTEAAAQNLPFDELLAMSRESVPEGKMSEAEKWLIMELAAKDPQAALDRINSTEHLDAEERGELDGIVLSKQAARSPSAALDDWLARNPGIAALPEAAMNTVADAIQSRPEEMIGWITRLPEGPLRDQFHERGIRSLAGSRRFDDALRLTTGIADSEVRTTSLIVLRDFWHNADPAAATKWVESLPPADRSLLGD